MKRLVAALAAAALLLVVAPAPASAVAEVDRFAGATRYDTAASVARLVHPSGSATAVLAAGTNYPDALSAGVAAAALDAPLLLASDDVVPLTELTGLKVTDVVLIGGPAALSPVVYFELVAAGFGVTRIAGTNRYETAAAVADLTLPEATRTLEASGDSFRSALVAAVHAARIGARLILSPDLPADVIVVDGDTLSGTPGELNQALLARFVPQGDRAVVTTIDSFPDALAAAAVAGALDVPVLFTETASATQESVDVLRLFDPTRLVVIGGTAAVPERVLQQLFGFVPLPPTVAPGAEDSIALDVFARVNDERVERGVAPLRWDPALAADASAWAREMSRSGYRHATLTGSVGENIHMPIGWCEGGTCHLPTSGLLHRDWMRSDDNRDNVLEMGYVIGGVGVHCAPDGTLWAVARFGIGFGGLTRGGTAPDPVVHDDTGGIDCSGGRS